MSWAVGVPGHEHDQILDAVGLVNKTAALGLNCLQIADNLPLHLLDNMQLSDLKDESEQLNIKIEVGTRGLTPENVTQYLEIASYFKSPILRVVIDQKGFEPEIPDIIAIIKDFLIELKKRNLILAIENHDRLKAREFASIVESTDPEIVGICLDTVNSMGAGEGLEEVVRILGPMTVNFHIKDFSIRRVSHLMGFIIEGTPAGKGMLPVEQIVEILDKYQKCESAILELWTPPESNMEDTIQKEEKWALDSVQYLKPFFT
jgi:sugar phosphate isomerase/epimerase